MQQISFILLFLQTSQAYYSAYSRNNNFVLKPKSITISNKEIKDISRTLRSQDVNKVTDLRFNFGEKIHGFHDKGDKSPQRLCQNFDLKKLLLKPTYKTLVALFDNYIANVNADEVGTIEENKEIDQFIDAIMNTEVIKSAHRFLDNKGFSDRSERLFKQQLRDLWFHEYSRAFGRIGSSGFEHVFLAEVKKGEVSGGHNWVFYCIEEQANRNNYEGYTRIVKGNLMGFRHRWNNYLKPKTSMFLGTSPEYEIAIATICFFSRPNKDCYIDYDGENIPISTYSIQCDHKTCLGTAFVKV